jgi:hypothetical protein
VSLLIFLKHSSLKPPFFTSKRPQTFKDILRGFWRQDRNSVSTARENAGSELSPFGTQRFKLTFVSLLVTFQNFDLRKKVEAAYGGVPPPATRTPESVTNWLDDRPRMGLDTNGIPIVLHIPGWQRGKALVCEYVC